MITSKPLILAIVLIFISIFFIAFSLTGVQPEKSLPSGAGTASVMDSIGQIRRDQDNFNKRLAYMEQRILGAEQIGESDISALPPTRHTEIIMESISRDNIDEMAVWQNTDKPTAFLVAVVLKRTPYEDTLLVWSGSGMLPFTSWRVEENRLLLLFHQSRGDFLKNNNFINIRYLPKE